MMHNDTYYRNYLHVDLALSVADLGNLNYIVLDEYYSQFGAILYYIVI
jgi:hypothetical protein